MRVLTMFLALAILATAAPSAAEVRNAGIFFGAGECAALPEGETLAAGERLILLAADTEPAEIRVAPAKSPTVPSCAETFRPDPPAKVVSLSVPESMAITQFFAVRPQPTRILTGPRARLSADSARALARVVADSLPRHWQSSAVLTHAYRYAAPGGKAVIELCLGLPTMNPPAAKPPIQDIVIRRLFIANGRLLASQQYERVSGREERIDTEAPQLTLDNWSASETEHTVAFLSDDQGGSWKRLSTDVGFEGIHWIVQALRPGLPEEQRSFLYTAH